MVCSYCGKGCVPHKKEKKKKKELREFTPYEIYLLKQYFDYLKWSLYF